MTRKHLFEGRFNMSIIAHMQVFSLPLAAAVLLCAGCGYPSYTYENLADASADADAYAPSDAKKDKVDVAQDSPMDTQDSTDEDVSEECVPTPENCMNGIDDDCDERIDCDDPDCKTAGFRCISTPPEGWEGYFWGWEGDTEASAPGCPVMFPDTIKSLFAEPEAAPATCSECCKGATGGKCRDLGRIRVYETDQLCAGPSATYFLGWQFGEDQCINIRFDKTAASGIRALSFDNPGLESTPPVTCPATAVQITKGSVSWKRNAIMCTSTTSAGVCKTEGTSCVPKTQKGFNSGVCIRRSGVVATCPAPFLQKHVYYSEFSDTRDCSPCACEEPKDVKCNVMFDVSLLEHCAEPKEPFASNECKKGFENSVTASLYRHPDTVTATCNPKPGAGQPVGEVKAKETTAITYCCTTD